ncbi:MAG: hypothetical protein ACMUJM_17020 [bacterium]
MPSKKREELYDLFATGNKPTQDDFADLIDSMINIAEDGIGASEKGKPMEIIEQGLNRRFLDFSSSKDTPTWRINAQSEDGERNGLNFSSNNSSRLFMKREDRAIGINNDDPQATLHIIPDADNALRVDDTSGNASLVIESNGNMGIGTDDPDSYKLAVDGTVNLKSDVSIGGKLEVTTGATVNGAKLEATMGATVNGAELKAENGLTVNNGATIQSGTLKAQAGAEVSGLALDAKNGVIVNDGIVIETGILEAKQGIVVKGAELTAEEGVSVIDSSLNANGQVVLGNDTDGDVTINGVLKAIKGALVNGAELKAEDGLTVRNGGSIETGLLTAQEGLSVIDSPLNANGQVILGNDSDGSITAHGVVYANKGIVVTDEALHAQAGAIVSGEELEAENGARVSGTFTALDTAQLGNTTIENLTIIDNLTVNSLNIQSIELDSLTANNATVKNFESEGTFSINGLFNALNNAVLGSTKIYASFEGAADISPKITIFKGTVNAGEGHFDITISDDKEVTVTYDDTSDIAYLISDWNVFQKNNPEIAEGFSFRKVGVGSWKIRDTEIGLYSSGVVFKEFRIPDNGIRIVYTGFGSETPQIIISANDDITNSKFNFIISGITLTIMYPDDSTFRTVENLLRDWDKWKQDNEIEAQYFEIQQTGDKEWLIDDASESLTLTNEVVREYETGELRIINIGPSEMYQLPEVTIKAAAPSSDEKIQFSVSLYTIEITLGKIEKTPQDVYNAWKKWKAFGNDTYGWDIKETQDTTAINVVQEKSLTPTDGSHSQTDIAGFSVTFTSDPMVEATVRLQESGDNFTFIFDTTLLTINYPINPDNRTVSNLLAAWQDVMEADTDTHGFDIPDRGTAGEIAVEQEETLETLVAVIKEYNTTTQGVDGICVRYFDSQNDTPRVVIQSQDAGNNTFDISIDDLKIMTIKYPANKSGTVDELLAFWEELAAEYKDNFSITKQDITQITVSDAHNDLVINEENNVFSKGIIRTNTITIDGNLRFGGSDIEINNISNNETLDENSNALLPTQKAVKTYVDNGLAVKADQATMDAALAEKADQTAMETALAAKADQATMEAALATKADETAMETALAAKADQTAMDSALATKADITVMDTALAEKADQAAMESALATKVDQTAMDTALATKADITVMETALAEKADQAAMESALATKVDQTAMDTALATKADITVMETALAAKADQAAMETALAAKADQSAMDSALATKADTTTMDAALAEKADQTAMETALATKADQAAMDTALAAKANLQALTDISVEAVDTSVVRDITLTADSRGMLMVHITTESSALAGIFAIHGTDMITKISGDEMADQQDGGTFNIYYDTADLTIQNTSAEEITVKVSYFGA